MPGTLIVEAGGILVQQGLLDYLDLVWFVAAGAILVSLPVMLLFFRLQKYLIGGLTAGAVKG